MSERALEGERTMSKMIPEYVGTYNTGTNLWAFNNGWESDGSQPGILYHESYFDLTGYELDDLTFMPISATLQDPGIYLTDEAANRYPRVIEMNVISQERISPAQMLAAVSANQALSFPETTQDWNNITFGEWKLKALTTEFANATLLGDLKINKFGSGSPCVTKKLWIYRIFYFVPANGVELRIPASRMVLSGLVTKEPEMVYIQRLRRNYELQGSLT